MTFTIDFITLVGTTLTNSMVMTADFVVFAYTFGLIFFELIFTIIGTVFIYQIVIALYKYNQTGELEYIYGMLEIFYKMAMFVFEIVLAIVNFIAGIIP